MTITQAAWARSFDRATYERLTRDYLEHLRAEKLDAGYVPVHVRTAHRIVTIDRVIPPGEIEALWTRLERAGSRRR